VAGVAASLDGDPFHILVRFNGVHSEFYAFPQANTVGRCGADSKHEK
jgi:hypothetical protein